LASLWFGLITMHNGIFVASSSGEKGRSQYYRKE
jgi:hypothetical protein